MIYVSPVVELLRARPGLVFWTAALAQALLWTLVPALFYASPPGDVPLVLAVGHEWQLGSWLGPPLAYWLAESAFELAGNSVIGVYALAQVCVVVTLWAVFALGRAIVGARHAAIAVLVMAGIAAFSVPTIDFGPAVLAMLLAALALLHTWRAVGEDRTRYWLALGVDLGLLMFTTYAGLILIGLIAAFTVATRRGRARLRSPYPWAAILLAVVIASPHLVWLRAGLPALAGFRARRTRPASSSDGCGSWREFSLPMPGSSCWSWSRGRRSAGRRARFRPSSASRSDAPARPSSSPSRWRPSFAATLAIAFGGQPTLATGVGPFLALSGLLVVLAAGNVIRIHRQSVVGWIWLALLVGPALLTVAAIVMLPWTLGVALRISEPSAEMARFFTESFNRRTGKPLAIVVGELAPRRPGGAHLVRPAEPVHRCRARARAMDPRGRDRQEGRGRGVDVDRFLRPAAAGDPGAVPRSRAGSAPSVRAGDSGAASAAAHRLGGDSARERAAGRAMRFSPSRVMVRLGRAR